MKIGDVAIYRDEASGQIRHAGIVVGMTIGSASEEPRFMILSQWGASGEYFHDEDAVMADHGSVLQFWSERRKLEDFDAVR